tara:strand:- start:258 stop:371 length:114 start_codon:yes stop_codon:yes gene_type:complete
MYVAVEIREMGKIRRWRERKNRELDTQKYYEYADKQR